MKHAALATVWSTMLSLVFGHFMLGMALAQGPALSQQTTGNDRAASPGLISLETQKSDAKKNHQLRPLIDTRNGLLELSVRCGRAEGKQHADLLESR